MPQTVSEWNVLNYSADFPGSKVGRVTGIPSCAFRNAASMLRNLRFQLMNSSSQISISSIFDLFSSRVSSRDLNKLEALRVNSFHFVVEIKLCTKCIIRIIFHNETQTLDIIISEFDCFIFEREEMFENRFFLLFIRYSLSYFSLSWNLK